MTRITIDLGNDAWNEAPDIVRELLASGLVPQAITIETDALETAEAFADSVTFPHRLHVILNSTGL